MYETLQTFVADDTPGRYKLTDVWITWTDCEVAFVEKSKVSELYVSRRRERRLDGGPRLERSNPASGGKKLVVDGFIDPSDLDLSDNIEAFAQIYSMLSVGLWQVPQMKSASRTYFKLVTEIEEFEEIDALDLTINQTVMWK